MDNRTDLYKKALCETMKAFVRFCEDNNLRYYACGGTCLGAIRHKGMIPWDDDIDVAMPRDDYETLLSLRQKVKPDFEIVDYQTPNYYLPYAKFSNANTTVVEQLDFVVNMGVYIDIFPFDEVGDLMIAEKLHSVKNKSFDKYCSTFKKISVHKIIDLLFHLHLKTVFKDLFYAKICKRYKSRYLAAYLDIERNIQKQKGDKCMYYGGYYGFQKELCDKKWFGEGLKVPFEDFFVIVPNDYNAYLSQLYGDYMTPPPVECRSSHHGRYFVYLKKRWDIREVMKFKINNVKNVIKRFES